MLRPSVVAAQTPDTGGHPTTTRRCGRSLPGAFASPRLQWTRTPSCSIPSTTTHHARTPKRRQSSLPPSCCGRR